MGSGKSWIKKIEIKKEDRIHQKAKFTFVTPCDVKWTAFIHVKRHLIQYLWPRTILSQSSRGFKSKVLSWDVIRRHTLKLLKWLSITESLEGSLDFMLCLSFYISNKLFFFFHCSCSYKTTKNFPISPENSPWLLSLYPQSQSGIWRQWSSSRVSYF